MGVIRILLALFVVIFHCGDFYFKTMPGPIAVQSFYIISGFYMSLILNEKYVGKNTYRLFITNRLLRLYPIYWSVLFLIIITTIFIYVLSGETTFNGLQPIHIYDPSMKAISIIGILFSNIFLFGQDIIMFMGLNSNTGYLFFTKNFALTNPPLHSFLLVPQGWTIGIELLFYLVAPFIVRRSLKVLGVFLLISIFIKFLLYKNGFDYDPWTYRFFPAEMLFFLLGAVSYKIYKLLSIKQMNNSFLRFVFICVIGVLVSYPYLHYYIRSYFYFVGFFMSLPLVFIYTKKMSLDRKIGEYSYPIYVSHVFVRNFFFNTLKLPFNLSVSTFAGSLFLSFFLYNYISKAVERIRQKRILNNGAKLC